jgi:hypothetical protein
LNPPLRGAEPKLLLRGKLELRGRLELRGMLFNPELKPELSGMAVEFWLKPELNPVVEFKGIPEFKGALPISCLYPTSFKGSSEEVTIVGSMILS